MTDSGIAPAALNLKVSVKTAMMACLVHRWSRTRLQDRKENQYCCTAYAASELKSGTESQWSAVTGAKSGSIQVVLG